MWPCFNPAIEVVTLTISSWMDVFLLPAFTLPGHICQDLLSPYEAMHVCTDLGLYSHPKESVCFCFVLGLFFFFFFGGGGSLFVLFCVVVVGGFFLFVGLFVVFVWVFCLFVWLLLGLFVFCCWFVFCFFFFFFGGGGGVGGWSQNLCQLQGENPLYRKKKSPQIKIEPTAPHQAGQRAQHTANQLFRPPRMI